MEPELEFVLYEGGRGLEITVRGDDLTVVPDGKPTYHMGRIVTQKLEHLPRWITRLADPTALRDRIREALLSVPFPNAPLMNLVPDEVVSTWTVRNPTTGASATMMASHRVRDAFPLLKAVTSEVESLAYSLKTSGQAPTDAIPNPHLSLWP